MLHSVPHRSLFEQTENAVRPQPLSPSVLEAVAYPHYAPALKSDSRFHFLSACSIAS